MSDFRQCRITACHGQEGAPGPEQPMRPASEIYGQRERPYDMRWGSPEMVKAEFGIGVSVLKSAWATGWVRARQGNWESDKKRTQSVYCFEDIHGFVERVMHRVSENYAKEWWTDDNVQALAEKLADGPYRRRVQLGGLKERKDGKFKRRRQRDAYEDRRDCNPRED